MQKEDQYVPSTGGEGFAPAFSRVDFEDGGDNEPIGEQDQQERDQRDEQANKEDCNLIGLCVRAGQEYHSRDVTEEMIDLVGLTKGQEEYQCGEGE